MGPLAARERPCFTWDYDITDAEFHATLAGNNGPETAWAIARVQVALTWLELPAMIKPVSLETTKDFYAQLAADLMRDAETPQ
jgi:hypothetical protein